MVEMVIQTVRALALKIASYATMHLLVALLVAYAITRAWTLARAFGRVAPCAQTFAFALHDRIWHRIERRKRLGTLQETAEAVEGRLGLHDHHACNHALPTSFRTLAWKTGTYGVMHFAVAVLVAFVLSGDWRIALAVGTLEPLVQTVFFPLHDRIWSRIERRRAERRAREFQAA
ncbi:MAG: DUF2061 domain-containing protein [Brevundimonas sp.]